MNYARRKGTLAETAIEEYMNYWWPDRDPEEGPVWSIARSRGAKDEADIHGPFTVIESKNYANPPVSSLLDNAEHKGRMSGRRYWWLVYKQSGVGLTRIYLWHSLTTLGEFVNGFGIAPQEDIEADVSTGQDLIDRAEELCQKETDVPARLLSPAPGREFPEFLWKPYLMFSDIRTNVAPRRETLIQESGLTYTPDDGSLDLPFIVYPRRDPKGMRPPEDWYVYSRLCGFATLLESLGIQPQDRSEYVSDDPPKALEQVSD